MAINPLQQYFRQPKIFISLPSGGIYNKPGVIQGDPSHMPVYGMTGMDEIIMKTPDALLSGDSTAKVIQSCCPGITDSWDLCNLDTDLILAAIRIATYGNELSIGHTCKKCGTENEYTFDLNNLIDHYTTCRYDNVVVTGDLSITIRPLTYKQSTEFSIRNFQLQQKLNQALMLEDEVEKKQVMGAIFEELAVIKNEVFATGIESIKTTDSLVTERPFILEFIQNADANLIKDITKVITKNQETWASPTHTVKCSNCEEEARVLIDLDQSNFFETA